MDENAVTSPLSVSLVLGIVVVLAVGALFAGSRVQEEVEPSQTASREAQAVHRDERYLLGMTKGAPVSVDVAVVHMIVDGVASSAPLSSWPELGTHWDVGEWFCVAGPGPECYTATADDVVATVVVDGAPMGLGSVSAADDDAPVVTYQGFRPTFFIEQLGGIVLQCAAQVQMQVIGTQITEGPNGADIPVYMHSSHDGGGIFSDIFGAAVHGGETHDMGVLPQGSVLGIWARASNGNFDESYSSLDDDPHVLVLRDGDQGPSFQPYGNQVGISDMLEPYVDENGYMTLEPHESIVLFEFTPDLNSDAADFQDLVVLYDFSSAAC